MHFSGCMDLILIRMSIRICMRLQEILFMERKTEMSQEEKYKLALFAVMANIMESCDYEKLKESYESGQI